MGGSRSYFAPQSGKGCRRLRCGCARPGWSRRHPRTSYPQLRASAAVVFPVSPCAAHAGLRLGGDACRFLAIGDRELQVWPQDSRPLHPQSPVDDCAACFLELSSPSALRFGRFARPRRRLLAHSLSQTLLECAALDLAGPVAAEWLAEFCDYRRASWWQRCGLRGSMEALARRA
jgi:hypothetical protein